MRFQGRISEWLDDKGYGFVLKTGTNEKAFIHIKSFTDKHRRPVAGDSITYRLNVDVKGRVNAHDIRFSQNKKSSNTNSSSSSAAVKPITGLGYITILFGLMFYGKIPNLIPVSVIGLSIVTYLAYAFDKVAAVKSSWRTQEDVLHFLSLLGGWPGAAIAQKSLRHKSIKNEFQAKFRRTVILNITLTVLVVIAGLKYAELFELLST